MPESQNGWPVLEAGSKLLHEWHVPATTGQITINLRNGSAGFLLVHFLTWFAEEVQPLAGGQSDDWGYAYRPIRGETSGFSNHAAGCAADANATKHPLGEVGTFTKKQHAAIEKRLKMYHGVIRWGGDYSGRKDEMHFEINESLTEAEALARSLVDSPRGKRVLAANPGQLKVIRS